MINIFPWFVLYFVILRMIIVDKNWLCKLINAQFTNSASLNSTRQVQIEIPLIVRRWNE